MNVTLVTTPVQQHKYVSISREAIHAWILYSVTLLTSKSVTSELLFVLERVVICVPLHSCSPSQHHARVHLFTTSVMCNSPCVSCSAASVCVRLRTLPAGTNPSLFSTDTWTCRRGAVCLQTSSRCRPPRATPAPSTSSR